MTVLHLRARSVPGVLAGLLVVTLLAWWAADWLSSRPSFDGPMARPPVVALAPVLTAVLVSTSLGGADEELERVTPRPWRRIRAAHVLIATVCGAAALALTSMSEPGRYGAYELIRNTAACTGMVAAAAPIVGAKLAWAPIFAYTTAVYVVAPKPPGEATAWWTWPILLSNVAASWWAAGVWLAAGLALYAVLGARAAPDRGS